MNILFKLTFYLKNPPAVVVLADYDSKVIDLLSASMDGWMEGIEFSSDRRSFPVFGGKILVVRVSDDGPVPSDVSFLLRRSSSPILIINKKTVDDEIFKDFPARGSIVADIETARSLKGDGISVSSVGFDDRADLWASDLNIGDETNFKINHGGDSVPFWIGKRLEKEEILEILLAVRAGMALGLNLVQISQNLKK